MATHCNGRDDWGVLLLELVERIAVFLPPNDVVCTLRLLCKCAARRLRGWQTVVHLSQPVPHHAFVHYWGQEHSTVGLTLERRELLIRLTAGSGSVENVKVALKAVACPFEDEAIIAAAAAGHLHVCTSLLNAGCRYDSTRIVRTAARAGHTAMVQWVLQQEHDCEALSRLAACGLDAAAGGGHKTLCAVLLAAIRVTHCRRRAVAPAAYKAAAGGHVQLTLWLLGNLAHVGEFEIDEPRLLVNATYGFELPALQRLLESRLQVWASSSIGREAQRRRLAQRGGEVAHAALASPTPDWRAKLEWLEEAVNCRLQRRPADALDLYEMGLKPFLTWPDAAQRVAFLQRRVPESTLKLLIWSTVSEAPLPVVQCLRTFALLGHPTHGQVQFIVQRCDVAVVRELLAARWPVMATDVLAAARLGRLDVLQIMAEPGLPRAAARALREAWTGRELVAAAARSGSLELVELLRHHGCYWDERAVNAASDAGNVALLEWMAAAGCPLGVDGEPYLVAGRNDDFATLRCLRRLGCPWDPSGATFSGAILALTDSLEFGCSLEVLRWLLDEGCPVDWRMAVERAERRGDAGVLAWVQDRTTAAAAAIGADVEATGVTGIETAAAADGI